MVAERRDLMVETYSSYCGTGAVAMVSVCTGIACGGACGGADLEQAVSASRKRGIPCLIQTERLLKTGTLKNGLKQSSFAAPDRKPDKSEKCYPDSVRWM